MMLKKLEIENVGPIAKLCIEFPKTDQGPKPLIIVGENGTGKSILLSHLVNALIVGKQQVYEDVEVEKGKVFKCRSSEFIKSGEKYSSSKVEFESGDKVEECQLIQSGTNFEEQLGDKPLRNELDVNPTCKKSSFFSTFQSMSENTKKIFTRQCCLYFPVNRFEEPAWLNLNNLKVKASYTEIIRIDGFSNRDTICTSPLKNNINWLLDLILDRTFDIRINQKQLQTLAGQPPESVLVFDGYYGPSSSIFEAVLNVIRVILQEDGNIELRVGVRKGRKISVWKDEKVWVPNLFQLSTGQVQLINLFLSIIRDYDLSEGELTNLSDIKGIVIIDEIDCHLHAFHQKEVLPELIKLFPNVQFVVTTHAPLFLIGMEYVFGEDGFEIINMPGGERVSASDFSEFIAAYEAFKETTRHREEILSEIQQHSKPIVFTEGDYDIRYLNKAAELLGKTDTLGRVQLKDGDGYGNLDKIWKSYNNSTSEIVPNKIILLYDCDTNKQDTQKNLVFKRVLPSIQENPISIGIENLFSTATIEKLEKIHPHFIDFENETSGRVRAKATITKPASWSVNKDEKGNMCDWLCKNGTAEDFSGFSAAFEIIESIIINT